MHYPSESRIQIWIGLTKNRETKWGVGGPRTKGPHIVWILVVVEIDFHKLGYLLLKWKSGFIGYVV